MTGPVIRWPPFKAGTPLDVIRVKLNDVLRQKHDAVLIGGERGERALNAGAELTTNVTDTATIAGKSAKGISVVYATEFMETFDAVPVDWLLRSGALAATLAGTGQTGGKALRQTGTVSLAFPVALPYDASKLHRLRTRAKNVSGSGAFTFGVEALDAAGAVLGSYAVAAAAAVPGASYVEYTGWVQGLGTPGAMPASDQASPTPLPANTATIRPYVVLNGGAPAGVTDLDMVSYERQDEEVSARVVETLLPSDDAERLASGAGLYDNTVHEPALQDASVSSRVVQTDVVITGRVESIDDPTQFLDLRTGLAPTDLVFSHPAFALYFDGTAVFSGEVAATSFTATLATFSGAIGAESLTITEAAHFGTGGTSAVQTSFEGRTKFDGTGGWLGGDPMVDVLNATWRFQASADLEVACALAHTGSSLGFFGVGPVARHANIADTSGAALAALETEVNALKALLRSYGLM
jgi:hypothetical protein